MFKKIKNLITRPELSILLLSCGITFFVAFLISLGVFLFKGYFWSPFFIITGLQFLFFIVTNTILQNRDANKLAELEIQALEKLSKFTIGIQCAYCKQTNNVPITLNQENRFPCTECNQINGIKMQFFTTQITTPIEKNPIEGIIEAATKTSAVQNL